MSYFTVCTPTFNRAYVLRRPFESLMKQTFRDFEWLVIDDGSTDDTKALVRAFMKEADFKIRYVRQENRGRAAALNTSYQHIKSKYVVNLDSDDAFTEDALQIFFDAWESIPEDDYSRFWCVTAHCVDNSTGEQIGAMWPENINQLTGRKQHKTIVKYKGGEKHCCRKLDVLKQYPFPCFDETNFVSESMVWEKINQRYDQYCINKVVSIYYTDSTDALSKSAHKLSTKHTYYYSALFRINECFDQFMYNKSVAFAFFHIGRLACVTQKNYRTVMHDINKWYKRVIVSLVYPVSWVLAKIYYQKIIFK